IGFDAVVPNLFGPLIAGQTVHLLPEGFDIARLGELLVAGGPYSFIKLTPSHLDLLTAQLTPAEAAGLAATVVVGAESFSAASLEYWRRLAPDVVVLNEYGPTEVTVANSVFQADGLVSTRTVPIGRPIPNTWMFVVDYAGELAEVGVTGELLVGGMGVVRGYHGRPDLTADKFIPDRFGPVPGGRLYRTEDLARVLPDGNVEFLGRSDDQIKIRGYRVEPGEVESQLLAHPAVREATVVVRQDTAGDPALVGYWVEAPETTVDAPALRDHLRRSLPEPMVPAHLVRLDRLPLTAHGKIDRSALPSPPAGPAVAADAPAVAASATELALAVLWQDVLGRTGLRGDDNFFDLGGHSLSATRLARQVAEAYPPMTRRLALRELFANPTLGGFAAAVDRAVGSVAGSPGPAGADLAPIRPVPRSAGVVALSSAQQRLWFHGQLDPDSTEYLVPIVLRLTGRPDEAALRGALADLVARHEVLRTLVSLVDGKLIGVVAPDAVVPFHLDRPAGTRVEREAAADELIRRERTTRFVLTRDLPIRARLIEVADDTWVLCLVLHHIAFDGLSRGILQRELAELYAGRTEGRPSALPPLPIQYADFAAWQHEWLSGHDAELAVAFWRDTLAGLPAVDLPFDRPRPARYDSTGDVVTLTLPPDLARSIRRAGRESNTTSYVVVLTALRILLARITGATDIAIGTPVGGRDRPELADLVGVFVNTVVMRGPLAWDETFAAALARQRDAVTAAFAYQDLPFDRLVQELRPRRDRSKHPLFQIMFAYAAAPEVAPDLSGLVMAADESHSATANFDLTLYLQETADGGVTGGFEYATALFDRATVEALADELIVVLRAGLADGSTPIRAFPRTTTDRTKERP
ncbi:non-ribosomal peptide synthetase, partial [Actinoplanes sp. ATCC 53533]|uniref:condensation domain-containing protein n=1 Tax=Actinoplanes sp. ATCC 53533 TaxID=1288362 RepID=UPI0010020E0C